MQSHFGPAYFSIFNQAFDCNNVDFFCSKYLQQAGYFLHNLDSQQVGATGCVGPLNHIYCRSLEEFEIACNQRWADCVGGLFKTIWDRTNEQINKQQNPHWRWIEPGLKDQCQIMGSHKISPRLVA